MSISYLSQISIQNQRIAFLEGRLAKAEIEATRSSIVTIKPILRVDQNNAGEIARRKTASSDWWPFRNEPNQRLIPSPGHFCLSMDAAQAKVIAFSVFDLSEEELESQLSRVTQQQILQRNFIPLFLTDAHHHQIFYRYGYTFEFFPNLTYPIQLEDLQERLETIASKWGVGLFINLGAPRGEWIKRDPTDLPKRYELAKKRMNAGAFSEARRLMKGFSEDVAAASSYTSFGRKVAKPTYSIVIVSYLDNPGVKRCLRSIRAQIDLKTCELILVDNGNHNLEKYGKLIFGDFTLVKIGFNSGASIGRNVGVHFSRSPHVIFLDDDGEVEAGCVDALLNCVKETGAISVRGRVLPLTQSGIKPPHYDLGLSRTAAMNTTEGVAIWARDAFVAAGGFDPLLYGHEGAELCSRLWRFYGPLAFVYEPKAILHHDFAESHDAVTIKKRRYELNSAYIEESGIRYRDINSSQSKLGYDAFQNFLYSWKPSKAKRLKRQSISILTTAKNAIAFLEEYTRSLKLQTDGDFEIIFIDDHSDDTTFERINELWKGDKRLKTFVTEGKGRGAALNTAYRHARGDICVVMDVDDLSVPHRIAYTREFYSTNQDCDCMSFVAFNERNPMRLGPPASTFVDDVFVRQLFGMPVSFPTFSFKRKHFPLKFNDKLKGGIDCDWLYRHLETRPVNGKIVFFPAVYYREHDGQITSTQKGLQLDIRKNAILRAYQRVLGRLSEHDEEMIGLLSNSTDKLAGKTLSDMRSWIANLLQANLRSPVFKQNILEQAMVEILRQKS